MNSPATHSTFNHEPVMANEITELFGSVPHGVVVDATLGGAGHAMRLLSAYSWMSVFGIDQDPMAIEHAAALMALQNSCSCITYQKSLVHFLI
jgi:16S rRNA (cytosine1402-N4)-methyltransferase